MKISGKVMCVSDDVDTDVIFPARYLTVLDWETQATHVFEALGDHMPAKVKAHQVIAAGWNMGCGSSREHAVTGLLGAGVKLVVAKSYARIFFRNAVNNGLAVIESPELADALTEGCHLEADLDNGVAQVGDTTIHFQPLPPFLQNILQQGGIWATLKSSAPVAGNLT